MLKALGKKSDIYFLKYKFFINRALIYFSFLLIPLWLQTTVKLNLFSQSVILVVYMLFMGGQWYLLGKEVDHRLKIYYRVNSSVDRVIYRLLLGSILMILLFNLVALFPEGARNYIFWSFFACVGLFYSWPTRGKIIEDSMTVQFRELRFLDSFERTVLFLGTLTFCVSLPEVPLFENIEALKLYFDPNEYVSGVYWTFLEMIYLPFHSYPKLYNLIWSLHFYFFGIGFLIFSLYSVLRHFYSRRLAFLGVFSLLSAWPLTRILASDYLSGISTAFSLIWLWVFMWSLKSGTYRSALIIGLIGFYGTIINSLNFLFVPITLAVGYLFFMSDQTSWYKRQWLKYSLMGTILALMVFVNKFETLNISFGNLFTVSENLLDLIYRKAFFAVAPIGLLLLLASRMNKTKKYISSIGLDGQKVKELSFVFILTMMFALFISPYFSRGFNFIWPLVFFALLPLDRVFNSISKLRSKRNIIYALYILVCLMDSQLENRVRIVAKMFLDSESFKYLIQL